MGAEAITMIPHPNRKSYQDITALITHRITVISPMTANLRLTIVGVTRALLETWGKCQT